MRLLALVDSPDHVCCRYRIRAFEPALKRAGWSLSCQAVQRGPGRVYQLFQAGLYDAVILQRELLPAWQLAILRRHARHLVFDFDDAVLFRDSYDKRGPHSAWRRRRFSATARIADAVVAGNDFLADCAFVPDARRASAVDPYLRRSWDYPLIAGHARRVGGRPSTWSGSAPRARCEGWSSGMRSGSGWARRFRACAFVSSAIASRFSRDTCDSCNLVRGVGSCRPRGRPHRRQLVAGRCVESGKMRPQGASVPGRQAAGDRQPGGNEHRADRTRHDRVLAT